MSYYRIIQEAEQNENPFVWKHEDEKAPFQQIPVVQYRLMRGFPRTVVVFIKQRLQKIDTVSI